MRVIVPGGYYSYDSAGKKIWLDYQYYGTTLENIEKIKNLTRNKILYDCKRSTVLPTVENGCITHSYPGNEADEDKIQVTLRTPITNSLTELTPVDGVVTLETDGKVLVLPTENGAVLPCFNEYVLNPNRLTVAESPFGGLKSSSPDYAVGTVSTASDNIYIRDIAGNNESKVLTAGKLNELNYLTINTASNSIIEEFEIINTSESVATAIIAIRCPDHYLSKTLSLYVESAYVAQSVTITDVTHTSGTRNSIQFSRTLGAGASERWKLSLIYDDGTGSDVKDLSVNLNNGTIIGGITKLSPNGLKFDGVVGSRVEVPINTVLHTPSEFMFLFRAKFISISSFAGIWFDRYSTNKTRILYSSVGGLTFQGLIGNTAVSLSQDSSAVLNTAMNFAVSYDGAVLKLWVNGVTVNSLEVTGQLQNTLNAIAYMGQGYSDAYAFNGELYDFSYFARCDESLIAKHNASEITVYDMPDFFINPTVSNMGSTTYQFTDSTNTSYGLQNLSKPWIALYDPANSLIDFYLFTHRPQSLSFKKDETGTIHELSLYPGTGTIYHGQIPFADLTRDTNSDSVPDCLDAAVNGSVQKFLTRYVFAGESSPVINDTIGQLSVSTIDASSAVPLGMFVSNTANLSTWTAEVVHDAELGCASFTTSSTLTGQLYIGGFAPATDSEYIFDIGMLSDAPGSEVYIMSSAYYITVSRPSTGAYRLRGRYTDDSGVAQLPYITIPAELIQNNKIRFSVTCDESTRTCDIRFSDDYHLSIPYRSADARNIPYTYVIHPVISISHYRHSSATYVTSQIYSITQKLTRKTITAVGNIKLTGMGIDYPRLANTDGAAYMNNFAQVGTAWADVNYLSPENRTLISTMLNDYGWELGIHFSQKPTVLSLEAACALMDAEVQTITDTFGAAPLSWNCLTNADTIQHAVYAYEHFGMLWRNGPVGVHPISNVGNLCNESWQWWNEADHRCIVYPCFVHLTDNTPAIAYGIDYSKFTAWCDAYYASDIKIVGFSDYIKRNQNQSEASFTILRNTDGYLRFTAQTNGFPCTVNVPSTYAHVEIYNQSGVAVPFTTLADSVSFEVENGGEYVVIKS